MHEEAESQVVAHERRDVRAQPLARAQAPEHLAGELGAAHVVADERHAPVRRAHLARERLGGVVQQRPPAQRLAARQLVGERLGQQRAAAGARRPRSSSQRALARSDAVRRVASATVRSSTSSVWP